MDTHHRTGELEERIFSFHPIVAKWGIKLKIKVGQLKRSFNKLQFHTKHDYLSSNGLQVGHKYRSAQTYTL
jgi:hypothetical protein